MPDRRNNYAIWPRYIIIAQASLFMISNSLTVRAVQALLLETLKDSPVVLIHGARQCGKTTLAQEIACPRGYHYISLDDDNQRAAAEADSQGFILSLPELCVIDEIQRVPALFTAIKASVDANRQPGRFILTGSANVLLLPQLADSLAGRMEILTLRPFSWHERVGQTTAPTLLQTLLDGELGEYILAPGSYPRLGARLSKILIQGGYPAAITRATERRCQKWYSDYATTLVQRDIRDLARIHNLDVMPRLLAAAASQSSRLYQITELAAPFGLNRHTIREYVALLQQIFLIDELPPWFSNRLKRLIKTPKLHLTDTGLAAALLGVTHKQLNNDRELLGQLLESFVYQELRKQAEATGLPFQFYHMRDKDGLEVDIVVEQGQRIAGVEVKAAASVSAADFKGLRKLQQNTSRDFMGGMLLYDGDSLLSFGGGLYAVPLRLLLQSAPAQGQHWVLPETQLPW